MLLPVSSDGRHPVDCLTEVTEDGRLCDGLESSDLAAGSREVNLEENVANTDWQKREEEVGGDARHHHHGAEDHGQAADEESQLVWNLGVNDIQVRGEPVEDPPCRSRLKERHRGVHRLLQQRVVDGTGGLGSSELTAHLTHHAWEMRNEKC